MPKQYPPAWQRVLARSTWQPNGCVEYGGFRDKKGYGSVSEHRTDGTRTHKAYRVVYEAAVRAVPGMSLHHICENPSCVNPFHLIPKTRAEHVQEHRPTHCIRGHEFTPENTYWHPQRPGQRHCLTCADERDRNRGVRRKTPCQRCGASPDESHRESCGYLKRRMPWRGVSRRVPVTTYEVPVVELQDAFDEMWRT